MITWMRLENKQKIVQQFFLKKKKQKMKQKKKVITLKNTNIFTNYQILMELIKDFMTK